MKTYKLSKKLLPDNLTGTTTYMHHEMKGTCYLGQIMFLEQVDPEGLRFPAESKQMIIPLTCSYRGRILNSPTTLAILNAYSKPAEYRDQLVKEALEKVGITVEWIEQEKVLIPQKMKPAPVHKAAPKKPSKVPRFSSQNPPTSEVTTK